MNQQVCYQQQKQHTIMELRVSKLEGDDEELADILEVISFGELLHTKRK